MSGLNTDWLSQIDHLVFAATDLAEGAAIVEQTLGVPATTGGKHPDRGTHNVLWCLGPLQYLEVIAPDPDSELKNPPFWMGLKNLKAPCLMRWAAKSSNIAALVSSAHQLNIPMGTPQPGQRKLSDGRMLKWQLTEPSEEIGPDPFPFLIDWGTSPHPATKLSKKCRLLDLQLSHPQADLLNAQLDTLGISIEVRPSAQPGIAAQIQCPKGIVWLQ